MATEPKLLHVSPKSELARVLKAAASDGVPIVVDTGESTYVLDIPQESQSPNDVASEDHDSLLNIIGVFSSGEENDVAQNKYRYLADAYDVKER